jgi:uncharacterized membrane protein YeaQ/YmgE (transglycosylase-associated protein family)
MLVILFSLLGAAAGLVTSRVGGDRELPLDLLTGALGACFGGLMAFDVGGATRPALAVALLPAVGFGCLLIGVVRVLSERLALES